MSLSVPERIAQCAEQIAADPQFGYSQPNRSGSGTKTIKYSDGTTYRIKGGDLDCSEMVRRCVNAALGREAIDYMWTGSQDEQLTAQGFTRMSYSASKVRRGDVLWVSGHTGVALGNGLQADAHGDEYGGITGPNRGDQTGHEVEVRALRSWTYIYRYAKDSGPSIVPASFTVTAGTERNVRSEPSTAKSSTITGTLKPGESVICRGLIYTGGLAWGVYDNYSGKVRYIALQGQVTIS